MLTAEESGVAWMVALGRGVLKGAIWEVWFGFGCRVLWECENGKLVWIWNNRLGFIYFKG